MKFPFKKANRADVWECFGQLDQVMLASYLDGIREGEDMELIVRKKISWDVSRMRKYFEGPVVDFVRDRYADTGMARGRGDIREALKQKFLGYTEEYNLRIPVSTTTLTRPKWREFLDDINHYCMDTFGCGLPEADNVDIGD